MTARTRPTRRSLLAILKQYDVKATFFVVGEQAEKHPELIQAEDGGGATVSAITPTIMSAW